MTDRYPGFLVTLDRDIREDDAEAIINALKMVKGVVSVQPAGDNIEVSMAKDRLRWELQNNIINAVVDAFDRKGP